ncbi:MAG: tRNA (N(6)-L-threonylcarbamoyladenosine(37)-C(2))-methylthiotransferase MtaB [candidate division NC10 bacterium]|nr:tRNA (N(6)-L-threonylcarbamoyladenosine(37)-C(2))-methylthiotransferase MtaB [candidate division NC10 bacterium]
MRIAFATVGCRLNQFETDALRGKAQAEGHAIVPFDAAAELYVINTCTITAEADADSRRLARQAVRRNPSALVAVTGCYAQAAPGAVAAIPGVDLVLGNGEKPKLLGYVQEARKNGGAQVFVGVVGGRRQIDDYGPGIDSDRTRAFLKVQDGCNYHCSFCIVPDVRGGNRSQPPDRILEQIRRLHGAGFPEVVLTGIHLGTYGRDLTPPTSLSELCRRIAALDEAPRLRLSSLDPHEVKPDLIRLLAESPRFCRHLHLPLQSGDEQLLRRMRRGHTATQFRDLVERLVAEVPGIAVSGDVIVGFPGEDDQAFQETCDLLEALPMAGMHVFSYSRRPGTDAAGYADQVPRHVKAERSRVLRSLVARKGQAFRRRFLGEALEVVVLDRDGPDGLLEGLSDNYLRVWFAGNPALRGGLARVRVEQVTGRGLLGSLRDGEAGRPPANVAGGEPAFVALDTIGVA